MQNFAEFYKKNVVPELKKTLDFKNDFDVPKIKKVVLNVGVGRFNKDEQYIQKVERNLSRISGQKPVRALAKKSISNFKIREGSVVGIMVTLRGERMNSFLEKLVKVTLPRVRDFRGISSKGFDRNGNYSLGFHEHMAFPEIRSDEVDMIHGLQVNIQTTAKNKEAGLALLKAFGFPFYSAAPERQVKSKK